MTEESFHLVNLKSQTTLDLCYGSSKNGTKVMGYQFRSDNNNQKWKVKKIENSEYFFLINVASQTALDLSRGSSKNGTYVTGWYHNEKNENQMWKIIQEPNEKDYFYLVNKRSGTALDLNRGRSKNGTGVYGWKLRRGNKNQLWKKIVGPLDSSSTLEKLKEEKKELEKKKDELETENLCVICFENKRNVVFLPCKHMTCCEHCSKMVQICPMDRGPIEKKVVVFQ